MEFQSNTVEAVKSGRQLVDLNKNVLRNNNLCSIKVILHWEAYIFSHLVSYTLHLQKSFKLEFFKKKECVVDQKLENSDYLSHPKESSGNDHPEIKSSRLEERCILGKRQVCERQALTQKHNMLMPK